MLNNYPGEGRRPTYSHASQACTIVCLLLSKYNTLHSAVLTSVPYIVETHFASLENNLPSKHLVNLNTIET